MSTLSVSRITNLAGTGDPDIRGAAKAFGSVAADGTLIAGSGYNVASIVKLGGGIYTINFTTPAPIALYAVVFSGVVQTTTNINDRTVNWCQVAIRTIGGAPTDLPFTFAVHW